MSKANRAIKCRIYPNVEQQILIAKTFGCTRFVYNHFLEHNNNLYKTCKKFSSYANNAKELTKLKKEKSFLKEVDSISLQQSLKHLNSAFKNFFESRADFPKFKKKQFAESYSTKYVLNNISFEDNNHIKLPKLGVVKIKLHRDIPSNWVIKGATVSRSSSGKFYVSILFEYENQIVPKAINNFVGLDYSMSELYVSSNGKTAKYPKYYRKSLKKLAVEQRKLSNCVYRSKNYYKQKVKVSKLHEKIANQRKDFLHKKSREITNLYDAVCIENLDLKEMSKPQVAKFKGKSGKIGFGKSISDNAWGMFTKFLEYKLFDEGKQLIKVDKMFPSSQLCHICGYKNSEIKDFSIRQWTCPICHTHHNRDINAAINLKLEGQRSISV